MPTWYAVYDTSTNDVVSIGSVLANPMPAGLAASTIGNGPDPPAGVWNRSTHVFDPASVLKPSLSMRVFWGRFTVAEREALYDMQANGTATQKKKLGAFRDYLTMQNGAVDLNDTYIQASVQLMETSGVLAAGRAAVVLT